MAPGGESSALSTHVPMFLILYIDIWPLATQKREPLPKVDCRPEKGVVEIPTHPHSPPPPLILGQGKADSSALEAIFPPKYA